MLSQLTTLYLEAKSDDDEFPRPFEKRCNFGTATERGGVLP